MERKGERKKKEIDGETLKGINERYRKSYKFIAWATVVNSQKVCMCIRLSIVFHFPECNVPPNVSDARKPCSKSKKKKKWKNVDEKSKGETWRLFARDFSAHILLRQNARNAFFWFCQLHFQHNNTMLIFEFGNISAFFLFYVEQRKKQITVSNWSTATNASLIEGIWSREREKPKQTHTRYLVSIMRNNANSLTDGFHASAYIYHESFI